MHRVFEKHENVVIYEHTQTELETITLGEIRQTLPALANRWRLHQLNSYRQRGSNVTLKGGRNGKRAKRYKHTQEEQEFFLVVILLLSVVNTGYYSGLKFNAVILKCANTVTT